LVGCSGAIGLYRGSLMVDYYWSSDDIIGILRYAIIANIFYSSGMVVELLEWYYLKGKLGLGKYRLALFILGTVFSCILTWVLARIYFFQFF
jgi:hypothetical protein